MNYLSTVYSQKIWRGIKFGSLAVLGKTAELKSAKIYTACMYVLCMAILFQTAEFISANTQFGGKPPNLMTTNISGYTVCFIGTRQETLSCLVYTGSRKIEQTSTVKASIFYQSHTGSRAGVELGFRV